MEWAEVGAGCGCAAGDSDTDIHGGFVGGCLGRGELMVGFADFPVGFGRILGFVPAAGCALGVAAGGGLVTALGPPCALRSAFFQCGSSASTAVSGNRDGVDGLGPVGVPVLRSPPLATELGPERR